MSKISPAAASIRNVVDTPWKQYPGHFGGALSKPPARPHGGPERLKLPTKGD
jgi:hypothetical protein